MFCLGGISDWWTVDEDCHLNLSWYRTPEWFLHTTKVKQ